MSGEIKVLEYIQRKGVKFPDNQLIGKLILIIF